MNAVFPKQVILDPDEIMRVNRVRIAQWLGITPGQVDEMPASDVDDVQAVMFADQQIDEHRQRQRRR